MISDVLFPVKNQRLLHFGGWQRLDWLTEFVVFNQLVVTMALSKTTDFDTRFWEKHQWYADDCKP